MANKTTATNQVEDKKEIDVEVIVIDDIKPNMLPFLGEDKVIVILNKKQEFVNVQLGEYSIHPLMAGAIHVSKAEFQLEKDQLPFRLPIDQLPVTHFLTACENKLVHPNKSGSAPFRLSYDKKEAGLQAFNILLACTEHTKDKSGKIQFTKKAKELVAKRFELTSETEIVQKCNDLRLLNWGSVKAYVDDIIHYPNFSGEVKIDEYCLQSVEETIKNTVLPI